ncbi:hypothetical protein C7441_10895 [Pseudaminobacter salicylatoxidans]|uniref:Auto-transporter adhesin head GIN domain-containing protein n=1 Tax=Pseudaminobacter salicylatoxidans TaxID=93369 RepID=A0A316C390_PSESE|nr:hypothetical protein [Pseudaminobacter salicylatoxidans]PWJ83703.1 hypothetical protein C7441_10895 [Pseudaminobacter salicylatoxidans]
MPNSPLLSLVFAAPLLVAAPAHAKPAPKAVDLSKSVTDVRIDSPAGEVTITTATGQPYRASIRARESGSNSSDSFLEACQALASIGVQGAALVVKVAPSTSSDLDDCSYDINANIPANADVAIRQYGLQASLNGDFKSVTTRTNAVRLLLQGHATALSMESQAVDADISFAQVNHNETIDISSKALNATLDFGGAQPISYSAEGVASWVDSQLPSTPGAKPSIRLKAMSVRATIR